jgi:uncharacterized protein with PIN domain
MQKSVYYCPKCDRTISRERLEQVDADLVERFGKSCLSTMRCPVCDTEFIDLVTVEPGGESHVGESRRLDQG